jgi:hypothetical protein
MHMPKETREKCQCKGCPGLPPTSLRPLMKCGVNSCDKHVCTGCECKWIDPVPVTRVDISLNHW